MHDEIVLHAYAIEGRAVWSRFAEHHYMTGAYHGHRAWLFATDDGAEVAFSSIMAFPHAHLTNAWREHRTVVLPDYQGIGLGARVGDFMAEHVITNMSNADGVHARLYSRTVHPRLGAYRDASPLWRPTGANGKAVSPPGKTSQVKRVKQRIGFSHEYVGAE